MRDNEEDAKNSPSAELFFFFFFQQKMDFHEVIPTLSFGPFLSGEEYNLWPQKRDYWLGVVGSQLWPGLINTVL